LVHEGDEPVGYFHVSPGSDTVDEVAWSVSTGDRPAQVMSAALQWGRGKGQGNLRFCFSSDDVLGIGSLRDAAHIVRAEHCRPDGQTADSAGVAPFLPRAWPDGMGILVKHLHEGPGLLAGVQTTDHLTEVMARHSWTWFDGDTM
jgi:hypothetical protein